MIGSAASSRKLAGILTEADGNTVYIGVGINIAQTEFPEEYRSKAASIIQYLPKLKGDTRFELLEKILSQLHAEIENPSSCWRERLVQRLYKKGEIVTFANGIASMATDGGESECLVTGRLSGISPGGELLIVPTGEDRELAFISGELRVY